MTKTDLDHINFTNDQNRFKQDTIKIARIESNVIHNNVPDTQKDTSNSTLYISGHCVVRRYQIFDKLHLLKVSPLINVLFLIQFGLL